MDEYEKEATRLQADISLIESGKANPRLNTLLKIIKALDAHLMVE
jgi:DNA-binding phage protein